MAEKNVKNRFGTTDQEEVAVEIERHRRVTGKNPTNDELAEALGITSDAVRRRRDRGERGIQRALGVLSRLPHFALFPPKRRSP